jgi:hypothetical protein
MRGQITIEAIVAISLFLAVLQLMVSVQTETLDGLEEGAKGESLRVAVIVDSLHTGGRGRASLGKVHNATFPERAVEVNGVRTETIGQGYAEGEGYDVNSFRRWFREE